jgi:hypothetical protein
LTNWLVATDLIDFGSLALQIDYFGGAYELTDGRAKSYYSFAGQTIMKDENGDLSYFLTDHLGSSSLVTDSSGAVINQTKYREASRRDNARWYDLFSNHIL